VVTNFVSLFVYCLSKIKEIVNLGAALSVFPLPWQSKCQTREICDLEASRNYSYTENWKSLILLLTKLLENQDIGITLIDSYKVNIFLIILETFGHIDLSTLLSETQLRFLFKLRGRKLKNIDISITML